MTDEPIPPDYELIQEVLSNIGSELSPEEVHGYLTAGFVTDQLENKKTWLDSLIDNHALSADEQKAATAPLTQLFDYTQATLASPMYEFKLLIPDDEEKLSFRCECLARWCQDFLTGLHLSGVTVDPQGKDDLSNALKLVQEVALSLSQSEQLSSSEDDEFAFSDMLEHLRMTIIFIYNELQAVSTQSENVTLH